MKSWQRRHRSDCHPVSLCILLALCRKRTIIQTKLSPSHHWHHNKKAQFSSGQREKNSASVQSSLTSLSRPVWVWLDRRAARSPGWCASPRCCSSASSWRCARRWGCRLRNSASALLQDCKLRNVREDLAKTQWSLQISAVWISAFHQSGNGTGMLVVSLDKMTLLTCILTAAWKHNTILYAVHLKSKSQDSKSCARDQYLLTVACVSVTSECSTVLKDCSKAMCWLVMVTHEALI